LACRAPLVGRRHRERTPLGRFGGEGMLTQALGSAEKRPLRATASQGRGLGLVDLDRWMGAGPAPKPGGKPGGNRGPTT